MARTRAPKKQNARNRALKPRAASGIFRLRRAFEAQVAGAGAGRPPYFTSSTATTVFTPLSNFDSVMVGSARLPFARKWMSLFVTPL